MESYAEIMELNIWLESTIERNPKYDAQSKTWTVKVNRKVGEDRTLKVNHLILASGFSGEPRYPDFPMDDFKGIISHSSGHPGCAGKGWEGKKAIVVGCCNSGHDIAADFCEGNVDTTIVQRSSTYFVSLISSSLVFRRYRANEEFGLPVDEFETRNSRTTQGCRKLDFLSRSLFLWQFELISSRQ